MHIKTYPILSRSSYSYTSNNRLFLLRYTSIYAYSVTSTKYIVSKALSLPNLFVYFGSLAITTFSTYSVVVLRQQSQLLVISLLILIQTNLSKKLYFPTILIYIAYILVTSFLLYIFSIFFLKVVLQFIIYISLPIFAFL